MSEDWLNDEVPIHKITFDERGMVQGLEEIFAEPFFTLETPGVDFAAMAYVYVNEKDAVVIGEELCWGRMFLQYEKYNNEGTLEKTVYFMKGDHTHVTKIGKKNYITWCDTIQNN